MKLKLLICVTICMGVAGCQQEVATRQPDSKVDNYTHVAQLNDSQKVQRDRAVAAKEKLFQSLLGKLTDSIGKNGVVNSIEVCKAEAPKLAKSVGDEFGLKIGRTSLQLRNAESLPPEWATSFVKAKAAEEVNVQLDDDTLAVLLPIRLMEACIKCHGDSDALAEGVGEALAAHYPKDEATGFAEGDLRGYFWIEVPAETK